VAFAVALSKEAEHVVALRLDRLFSDAEDALHQMRVWDKAGIASFSGYGRPVHKHIHGYGKVLLSMMAGFAKLERNLIAERTALALAHKKAHREAYSPTPYGFNRMEELLKGNEQE